MNSSIKGIENESNFFIKSFFESLSNFIKNVKIEIKDVFELLNYPCVYQNCKKKFSISENEEYKSTLETNVISKIDKKNIENFQQYQKELQKMLENIKEFNEKYRMDVPLLFIIENLITLHLINEYKINNIVRKIQDHNIAMPELKSDLPSYLVQTLEVEESENDGELGRKLSETSNLSINNSVVKDLLETSHVRINLSKLREQNEENYFHAGRPVYSSSYNSKSNDLLTFKKEENGGGEDAHGGGGGVHSTVGEESNLAHMMMKVDERGLAQHRDEEDPSNMSVRKKEEKKSIIENIGLSEETLKLLNLLPQKRKAE
ncbi:conserved Plasmodium protein, unknown function [Plasmodium knowlesi strain H]|uniref:Uncharacterized protein n=3 Tax=Plasmodium knowlesi TaxID=5850 RepID=A0A5K1UDX1_PLAKH|nr:conserved Plasmodium protein, unknown function [Plasmodium knowlesi strain H]OTN66158.1 Uncharacterized protein PKNOH_S09547600 [Plasmodium knowlesi]CAA9989838.1 conserved Plasmodium protein, unknown function [Plasmodium knowlesi strain H]SBO24388.1 conserved Plasmodium protein, unknown function [Plasmodium knowlesi strain H]SBO26629.1 conserved Plasmodium protein, unknown function [Plasmodium knowlesi strain H]VVS79312.1 conserved Plasmodium protein, unknown function [Plasmodium knowlesi s|eukprot:XP_002259853.1 hypothetical protein, conserved in Plasmodium species [Plasmodium knowlesi strain H]